MKRLKDHSLLHNRIGIYEKALYKETDWQEKLLIAYRSGYSFIEISIDETEDRINRLFWNSNQKRELKNIINNSPIGIETLCLSGNRKYPLGSSDPHAVSFGIEMIKRAIDLSLEIGIRIIQIAGYDVYYEESTESTKSRYIENLFWVKELAERNCIMLGIENVDKSFLINIKSVLDLVKKINSPWIQIYGDFGNSFANGFEVNSDLQSGAGHIVCLHLKDTLPGKHRNVLFGDGNVYFDAVFEYLTKIKYMGPFVVEMWNESNPMSENIISHSLRWLQDKMKKAEQKYYN